MMVPGELANVTTFSFLVCSGYASSCVFAVLLVSLFPKSAVRNRKTEGPSGPYVQSGRHQQEEIRDTEVAVGWESWRKGLSEQLEIGAEAPLTAG